ncbi:MAG: hypothetical protein ACLUCH_07570 [Lachnospirales bacterium]
MKGIDDKSIYIIQLDGKDVLDTNYKVNSFKKYKVAFDYSLDLIKLRELQKRLLPNEKNFYKNKGDSYDHKTYSDLLVSVTFKYKTKMLKTTEIRQKLYKNGFYLEGKHYVRFKRSSGSSRLGKCLFIRKELYDDMMEYSYMGLDFPKDKEVDLASLEAYISLTTSSIIDTIKINPSQILVIPDYESEFEDDVIATSIVNGKLETKKDTVKIKNSIFDGQSMLDVSVFEENGYGDKGMLLLRNRFFKSCCFNTNIQQFFNDRGITNIKQLNGFTKSTKIENIKLITTPSSIKYLKFGSLEEYFSKLNRTFGVVKYDKPPHFFEGNLVQTHYQLLNTLEFTKKEMKEFLDETLQYIKLLKNEPDVMRYHLKMNLENLKNQDEKYYNLETTNNFIYTMLGINDDITRTNMYLRFLSNLVTTIIKDVNNGHILINGNYSTLFGNAMEMLEHSINNFKGNSILNIDEVISKRFEKNIDLLGIRSPHITMGNVWLIKNVQNNDIDKYFNITQQIVIINSIGNNLLERIGGADFDSDTVLLTDNKILLNKAKENYNKFLVPTSKVVSKKTIRFNNYEHKADLDTKTSVNKIGEIVNLSQILNSRLWEIKKLGLNYDDIYNDVCKLAVMSTIEIDKAKKEFDIDMIKELKNLREKYCDCVSQRPMFFNSLDVPDTYKKDIDKYRYYETSMDYLVGIIKNANRITQRKYDKSKIPLYELFKETKNGKRDFRQIYKINEIIASYKKENNKLWNDTNMSNSEKYFTSLDMRENLINHISKIKINETTIYRILKNVSNTQQILMISILFNSYKNIFLSLIKEKKSDIHNLFLYENGDISIYGLKFSKK